MEICDDNFGFMQFVKKIKWNNVSLAIIILRVIGPENS